MSVVLVIGLKIPCIALLGITVSLVKKICANKRLWKTKLFQKKITTLRVRPYILSPEGSRAKSKVRFSGAFLTLLSSSDNHIYN